MAPSIDPAQWTYTDYICFLRAHGFHNLGILDEYLQWGANARSSPQIRQPEHSRTTLLEFSTSTTRVSDLSDVTKLRVLLNEWTRPSSSQSTPNNGPNGRIIMVENIAPSLVDTLGGALNIDPNFFASHLEDSGFGHCPDASSSPALASTTTRNHRDFFNVEYISAFTPLNCGKDVEGLSLQCKGNYSRRIELVHKQGRQKVALARRKISFFMKPNADAWLCVVLVDPPLANFSIGFSDFNAVTPSQIFDVIPYRGGYLDFVDMRKPLHRKQHDFRDCRHRAQAPTPFDDLVRHFQIQARDGLFRVESPDLASFMRPVFQIAASECGNFFAYIQATIESQNPVHVLGHEQWRIRRNLDKCIFIDTLLSRYKPVLSRIKDYVHSNSELKEDFRQLLLDLHHYRAECDSLMQHITSILQSHESTGVQNLSKEAMRRADYLRYLTIIALIYAPFAIACAVFTMPHDFVPAAHYLYGFLPVTAAVTVLFVILVLPESRDPIPNVKDRFCGGLTKQRLLGKRPESRDTNTTASKRWMWDEV